MGSKTIRVSDNVFDRIQALQAPRETVGQVIDRCLSTVEALKRASDVLGPSHYLKERPKGEG